MENEKGRKKERERGLKKRKERKHRGTRWNKNKPSLRGDVFSPKVNEAEDLDLVYIPREELNSKLQHKDLNLSVDCSFDLGVCGWKQDREDDFDWNPADRDDGI